MQEELERKSISVTVQAAKLTGRVMRAAVAAALRKIEKERTTPKVGRNSLRRLTAQTPDAHKIEVEDRIRSFERYAKKYKVRYHVEKDISVSPPKWTVYFKASQADAIEAAFKKYTQKTVKRENRPSLLSQLSKFKEMARKMARDPVKNKEHGGPECFRTFLILYSFGSLPRLAKRCGWLPVLTLPQSCWDWRMVLLWPFRLLCPARRLTG